MEENKMLYFITWESRGEGRGLQSKLRAVAVLQACSHVYFKAFCFRLDRSEPV